MRKTAFFRFVFQTSRWFRERLTPAGLVVAGLTGFAAAFGIDTEANLAHVVFALGAGLLLVDAAAALLGRRRPPRLDAVRQLPDFVTAHQAARYRIAVRNRGRHRLAAVDLVERLRQPWPVTLPAAQTRAGASKAAGNRFDRRVGYPAYLDLLRRLRAVEIGDGGRLELPPLLPGQGVEIEVAATPTARGLAVFEGLAAIVGGPLGLVEMRVPVAVVAATLPVLPARLQIALPPPSGHRLLHPGGIALAQHVGEAEEFRSLRDYRPGDPLRAIHWRSFARTGRPVVREFQEEFFARHALLLDTAAPDPFAPAFETAVSIAAGLVARPRDADCLLDLMFVGDRVHRLTAGRGLGGADTLLCVLASVAPGPADGITDLLAALDRHAGQVSSIVTIFLRWDAPRQQAIRRLLARGIRPTVLLVEAKALGGADDAADKVDDAAWAGVLQRIAAGDPATPAGAPAGAPAVAPASAAASEAPEAPASPAAAATAKAAP